MQREEKTRTGGHFAHSVSPEFRWVALWVGRHRPHFTEDKGAERRPRGVGVEKPPCVPPAPHTCWLLHQPASPGRPCLRAGAARPRSHGTLPQSMRSPCWL